MPHLTERLKELDTPAEGQVYMPDYGYTAPMQSKRPCGPIPAFAHDMLVHRLGVFRVRYVTDGLAGWITEKKCVNCGQNFGPGNFYPDARRPW